VTLLRFVNVLLALLAGGVATGAFALWTYPALGGGEASTFLAACGGAITVLLGMLSLAHVGCAVTLGRGRGRALQTTVALLLLPTLPIGTAYGCYALWVCWANPETRARLSVPPLAVA